MFAPRSSDDAANKCITDALGSGDTGDDQGQNGQSS